MSEEQHAQIRAENIAAAAVRLANETGITEPQARDLISLLGLDWSSLIREARLLAKRG